MCEDNRRKARAEEERYFRTFDGGYLVPGVGLVGAVFWIAVGPMGTFGMPEGGLLHVIGTLGQERTFQVVFEAVLYFTFLATFVAITAVGLVGARNCTATLTPDGLVVHDW